MSEQIRQTRIMHEALADLNRQGATSVCPGDLAEYMRNRNLPMDTWAIVGELNRLAELGLANFDAETASWQLAPGRDFAEVLEQWRADSKLTNHSSSGGADSG